MQRLEYRFAAFSGDVVLHAQYRLDFDPLNSSLSCERKQKTREKKSLSGIVRVRVQKPKFFFLPLVIFLSIENSQVLIGLI